ncbi:MAG: alanine racemase [Verrucomicrobiae bacterium]|nr:alanine racemase [Verrucomicrobiae bacterium]
MKTEIPFRCWAEIDLDALAGNLRQLRSLRDKSEPLIAVIKANAYGHGAEPVARRLWREGVRMAAVANVREAAAVSRAAPGLKVLLLSPLLPVEIGLLIKRPRWIATVSSLGELALFERAAARQRKKISVHLELDTGMGRTGAFSRGLIELLRRIRKSQWIEWSGLFSHLTFEDINCGSARQLAQFKAFCGFLSRTEKLPFLHFESSSGGVILPGARGRRDDPPRGMRCGLALYGIPEPLSAWTRKLGAHPLRPVLTWKTRIGLVREMPAGTPISYGGTFRTRRKTRVAVLCAGYADGLPRKLSNRGEVLIHGRRCRILGRVTMDMVMVDVTRLPRARWGDEVVLIGKSGRDEITAGEFAGWAETISYEVLCGISSRVSRIYEGGGVES